MTKLTLDRIQAVAEHRIQKEGHILFRLIDQQPYHDKLEELKQIAVETTDRIEQTEIDIQEIVNKEEALRAEHERMQFKYPSNEDMLAAVFEINGIFNEIDASKRRKEILEQCSEQLVEYSETIQSIIKELDIFERESCYILNKEELLADKVLLCVLKYLDGNYHSIDDFEKRGRYGTDTDKSFRRFVDLTSKGIRMKDYRKSFSRIVSWLLWIGSPRNCSHINQYYRVTKGQELLFYKFRIATLYPGSPIDDEDNDSSQLYRDDPLSACDGPDGLYEVHAKDGFIEGQTSPFEYGSLSDRRSLHETFCKILTDMGTLEDAVQVATEYPDFVVPSDIVRRIDNAIQTRQRVVGEKLLGILMSYEAAHPDVPRLKNDLSRLGKIAQLQVSANFDLESLNEISGAEFEHLIALKFEELGFQVVKTPATGDYGADLIIVTPNETRISVQCKRFRTKVNLKAVQEVVASLSHYQCDFGIVVTNSSFLNSAKKLAENNEIELWDQDRLISFLSGDLMFSELSSL